MLFLNKIINPLINASPEFYERFMSYLIPASEILFILQVIKDKDIINKRTAEIKEHEAEYTIDTYEHIKND